MDGNITKSHPHDRNNKMKRSAFNRGFLLGATNPILVALWFNSALLCFVLHLNGWAYLSAVCLANVAVAIYIRYLLMQEEHES